MSYILSLEDDIFIQKFVTINLKARGFLVKAATTVEEALSIVLKEQPRLVILDMRVSGANGTEFLQICLDNPMLRSIPVIIFTALPNNEGDEIASSFPNVVGYLVKPISVADLLNAVNQAIGASTDH